MRLKLHYLRRQFSVSAFGNWIWRVLDLVYIKCRLPLTHLRETRIRVPHLPWFVSFSISSSSTFCLSRSYSLVSIPVYSFVPSIFLCFSVWSSLFLLFLIKRWYSFDMFQPFLRPKPIAGLWRLSYNCEREGSYCRRVWCRDWRKALALALMRAGRFRTEDCWCWYWGTGGVCVFVVHVIVSGFYSVFLSHPVIHSIYRPITFLLWTFVFIVFRCLSLFLTFSSLSSSTSLVLRFFFAEYWAFSGPPWLWQGPIAKCVST
jgi:hypothetical protein